MNPKFILVIANSLITTEMTISCELLSVKYLIFRSNTHYFTLAPFPAPNNTKLKDIHQEIESTWRNIANFLSGSAILVSLMSKLRIQQTWFSTSSLEPVVSMFLQKCFIPEIFAFNFPVARYKEFFFFHKM